MAGMTNVAQTAEIALAAATTKTIVQIAAPANQRLKVKEWAVFFDGTSATAEPVQVELLRQTTAGTMSALTLVNRQGYTETIQTTGQTTATVEPTAGNVLAVAEVHPQQGYHVIYGPGDEIHVPGGGRIGIRVTAPAIVNVRGMIVFEE